MRADALLQVASSLSDGTGHCAARHHHRPTGTVAHAQRGRPRGSSDRGAWAVSSHPSLILSGRAACIPWLQPCARQLAQPRRDHGDLAADLSQSHPRGGSCACGGIRCRLPSVLSAYEASALGCLLSGISAVNHPAARTENIQVAWRDALVGSAFAVIMQMIGDVDIPCGMADLIRALKGASLRHALR